MRPGCGRCCTGVLRPRREPRRRWSISNGSASSADSYTPWPTSPTSTLRTTSAEMSTQQTAETIVGAGADLEYTFVADPGADGPVLCLAAGSGLAPIRALAEDAVRRAGAQRFTVLFSARTQDDVMNMDRFASWQRQYPDRKSTRLNSSHAN